MNTATNETGTFYYRFLAAVAMIGPILLVIVAGTLPADGTARGDLIVTGHEVLVGILVTAVALRAAYIRGFSKAFKLAVSERSHSATA